MNNISLKKFQNEVNEMKQVRESLLIEVRDLKVKNESLENDVRQLREANKK